MPDSSIFCLIRGVPVAITKSVWKKLYYIFFSFRTNFGMFHASMWKPIVVFRFVVKTRFTWLLGGFLVKLSTVAAFHLRTLPPKALSGESFICSGEPEITCRDWFNGINWNPWQSPRKQWHWEVVTYAASEVLFQGLLWKTRHDTWYLLYDTPFHSLVDNRSKLFFSHAHFRDDFWAIFGRKTLNM